MKKKRPGARSRPEPSRGTLRRSGTQSRPEVHSRDLGPGVLRRTHFSVRILDRSALKNVFDSATGAQEKRSGLRRLKKTRAAGIEPNTPVRPDGPPGEEATRFSEPLPNELDQMANYYVATNSDVLSWGPFRGSGELPQEI